MRGLFAIVWLAANSRMSYHCHMRRRIIILLLMVSVVALAARRRGDDTTYHWKEQVDAVGRLLSLDDGKFLGAAFYTSPYGAVLTASHVVSRDTVLFEHIHSRESDTLVVLFRLPHHDLAVLRPLPSSLADRKGLQLGSFGDRLDSVIYLGLRDNRTLFRFDAAVSGVGEYTLPGDSIVIRAIAIDAEVLGGMSGGPVLNDRGEVVAVLVGRLTDTPQGGDDSTAVLAIPTDTLRILLDAETKTGK